MSAGTEPWQPQTLRDHTTGKGEQKCWDYTLKSSQQSIRLFSYYIFLTKGRALKPVLATLE